jgi:DNA-binding transcriptional MerR regulator
MLDCMEKTLTAAQAAELFNCTRETIRAWSIEFKTYLTPDANPRANQKRLFTEKDLRVLAKIAELKDAGKLYSDIHEALGRGDRGDPPDTSTALAPMERGQISKLQTEVEKYRGALSAALEDSQRKAGQIELLERQLSEAQAKIDRLIGENAVLKSKGNE